MANKSTYPESVEVHARHLTFESDSRVADENQLRKDGTSRGIASGLTVTVNGSDNTRIDVATGTGYTPNGEYLNFAVAQTAVQLASNVLGTQNYVILMQDATASSPESHETDGTTRNTKSVNTGRLLVLTAAQYSALPMSDVVLSNNAQERALLVAIVTGTGGALTGNSIQLPSTFRNALQTNQPTNITGLTIIAIDSTTATGTGTFTFLTGPKTITWQAPGEGSPGGTTTFVTSQVYTVTSSGGKTIQVNVAFSLLPVTNQSDSIVVTDIYVQTVPRFSAGDYRHRSLLGTGIPTTANPHGLTIDDLSPGATGTLEEHQDIMHSNGITRTSNAGFLGAAVNTGPVPDTVTVTGFAAGDLVYINGKRKTSLVSSNVITFADGSAEPASYSVFLGQDANLYKQTMARFPVTGVSLLYTKVQILDVVGVGAGTYNLTWTTAGNLQFDSGPTITAPVSLDHQIRVYNSARTGYLDLWVKGTAAPGVNQTDAIVIFARPDPEENVPVCNIVWSGSATGFAGAGFGAANSPNFLTDTRLYGTLAEVDTRADAGIINAALLMNEVLGDGIILGTRLQSGSGGLNEVSVTSAFTNDFALGTLAYPNVTLTGGSLYVGGHRFVVPTTTLTISNNVTNRIYINYKGLIQQATTTWAVVEASELKPFQRLWDLSIAAGAETSRLSLREYVGQKRDVAFGAVVFNQHKEISATSASTATAPALLVTSGSSGNAIGVKGIGSGTSPGVQGFGSGGNSSGLQGTGTGNNPGLEAVGGSGSTAGTISFGSGSTNGIGAQGFGAGTGYGVHGRGAGTGASKGWGVYGEGDSGATIPAATLGAGVVGSGGGVAAAPGVYGLGSDTAAGLQGLGGVTNGMGVKGTGVGTGVGVEGNAGASSGAIGVKGNGSSTNGIGVYGDGPSTGVKGTGQGQGVLGIGTTGTTGDGVDGTSGTTGGHGVKGITNHTAAYAGVYGQAVGTSNLASIYGVTADSIGGVPAVKGVITGTMDDGGSCGAVVGDSSGSNTYALVAKGDTTTPVRAAFRMVPQDAEPSGNNRVGDMYVTTAGVLKICTAAGTPGSWISVGNQV